MEVISGISFKKENESVCIGSVFRADVGHFQTSSGFGFSVRLKKVKKLSCTGCDRCGFEAEAFSEVSNDWPIVGIENAEHGKLYKIITCNEQRDYETGIIDQWDLKLIEYDGGKNA